MDRALYDFAEAAMGRNSEMNWSLSEAILRRQIAPVFTRCARGDLSADQALDVALDFVAVRVANTREVFNQLYQRLEARIDVQLHGEQYPALLELDEFFMGLNLDAHWATDKDITARELLPVFVKVRFGTLTERDGVAVFCDMISSKKEFYLDLIHAICLRLTRQIAVSQQTVISDEEQRTANGDE